MRQYPQLAAPDDAFSLTGAHGSIVFIKEPSSQDALQGRRALLRCEVEAPGHIHVYWLLDGVQVHDTERRFAQGSSLSFTAVDRLQDSGTFQCVARDNSTGEEARSANATFNIKCEDPVRHPLPRVCSCRPHLPLHLPSHTVGCAVWPLSCVAGRKH